MCLNDINHSPLVMKKILSIIACMTLLVGNVHASFDAPDFSQPKTVLSDAQKALKAAKTSGDEIMQFRAMMQIAMAQSSIDNNSGQQSYEVFLNARWNDAGLKALSDLYAAKILNTIYDKIRWEIRNRDLPLTPRPADINQWSPEMFDAVKDSLTKSAFEKSFDPACRPLKDYSSILDANKLTYDYYTRVTDMIGGRFTFARNKSDGQNNTLNRLLSSVPVESNTWYLWKIAQLNNTYSHNVYEQKLLELYNSSPRGMGAALVLAELCGNSPFDNTPDKKVEFLKQAANQYKGYWVENTIINRLNNLLNPNVNIRFNNLTAASTPTPVYISYTNTPSITLKVYNLPINITPGSIKFPLGAKPVQTINVNTGASTAQQKDTTIYITLSTGYNFIKLQSGSQTTNRRDRDYIRTIEYSPIVATQGNKARCFILSATNGKPVSGVKIYSSKTVNRHRQPGHLIATTDHEGMAIIDSKLRGLYIKYPDGKMVWENINTYYSVDYQRSNNINMTLTTDLSTVHPGDSIRLVGIAADTLGVVSNHPVRIILRDSQYNDIDTLSMSTDSMGRVAGAFVIPRDTRTGSFSIYATNPSGDNSYGSAYFNVSDFKVKQYLSQNVKIRSLFPTKNQIIISGRVVTYSGQGVSDAVISALHTNNDSTYTANTDNNGCFSITINHPFKENTLTDLLKADNPYSTIQVPFITFYQSLSKHYFTVTGLMPDGSTLDIGSLSTNCLQYNLSMTDSPFDSDISNQDKIKIKVSATDYDKQTIKCPIIWKIIKDNGTRVKPIKAVENLTNNGNSASAIPNYFKDALLRGEFNSSDSTTVDLSTLTPGRYKFLATNADSLSNTIEEEFTVFNPLSEVLPDSTQIIYIPDGHLRLDKNNIIIPVLSSLNNIYILYSLEDELASIHPYQLQKGWNYVKIQAPKSISKGMSIQIIAPDKQSCQYNASLYNLKDLKAIDTDNAGKIKILTESFRDRLTPTAHEYWTLTLTDGNDKPIEGAVVASMWNSRLNIFGTPRQLSWPQNKYIVNRDITYDYGSPYKIYLGLHGQVKRLIEQSVSCPSFMNWMTNYDEEIGVVAYGTTRRMSLTGAVNGIAYKEAKYEVSEDAAEEEEAPVLYEVASSADTAAPMASAGGQSSEAVNKSFSYRDKEVFSALWRPMLNTDALGKVNLDFIVPNENSKWDLRIFAWTKDGRTASLEHTFTTSKPVMVQANAPRFTRRGDIITTLATVLNATDSTQSVTTVCELLDPITGKVLATSTSTDNLTVGGKALTSLTFIIPDTLSAKSLTYRVKSSTDTYADGEQITLPVLPSQSFVREAINFYLNPSDSTYTCKLPTPTGTGFNLDFSYTANPMATIIEALPTLWHDCYPTAISQSIALYGSSIALGLSKQHPEVKQYLISKKIDAKSVADKALEKLIDLQQPDGGFRWGTWCNESSLWVTMNVIDNLADLKRLGYLDNSSKTRRMIDDVLNYVDANVRNTNTKYTIARSAFPSRPSLNGQKVIDATLRYITRDWKKMNINDKAVSALALTYNQRRATARQLISSLDQFATQTPNKGLQFKNERSLLTYGHLLEAYNAVSPDSKNVDGLRQYLIYRRQATDWGNSLVTSYVVSSMLNSGTRWSAPKTSPSLTVDSAKVTLSDPQGPAMTYRANISGSDLTLALTETGAPSYGAVIASYTAKMDSIAPYSEDDEISITKRLMIVNDDGSLKYTDGKDLKLGQRVRVLLTIVSPRPMSYVNIVDERAASFEPVEQLPVYRYNEGIVYYRENRDSVTNYYINYLPQGTRQLVYDVRVNNAGEYSSGIATVTCDQAPTLTAHSAGSTISVLPQ